MIGFVGLGIVAILIIAAALLFVFWLWMLIDCLKRPDGMFAEGGNNTRLIWILVIIFTGLIGALIYYFLIKKADTQNDRLIVIALLALLVIVIILIASLFAVNTVSTISIEPHTSSKLIESTPYETAVSSSVNQTPSSHAGAPAISAIQPDSGTIGTKVVIIGTGFTARDNNVAFRLVPDDAPNVDFKVGYINNLVSHDGKTIEFVIPDGLGACAFPLPETIPVTVCPAIGLNFKPNQTYPVFVVNQNGTSNSVNFTLSRKIK